MGATQITGFEPYADEIAKGDIALYVASAKTPEKPLLAINEDALFYPASLCKLFYLACFYDKVQTNALIADDEDSRALKNMVAHSSNDATGYIVNRLCGTSSGAMLDEEALLEWLERRKSVQYWLQASCPHIPSMHYRLYHSTFDESPYGRDKQAREVLGGNLVSPFACAQMMARVFDEEHYDAEAIHQMKRLLSKDVAENRLAADGFDQVTDFIAGSLPDKERCWSKAGWTSWVKHEAAYISLEDRGDFIVSIFTSGEGGSLFSDLTKRILRALP